MRQNQTANIIWIVFGIIYGFGVPLVDHKWFTMGGAAVLAIIIISIPIWKRWLPADSDQD